MFAINRKATHAPIRAAVVLLAMIAAPSCAPAHHTLRVAYAGSMGAVMDRALGPSFADKARISYQGIGGGAYGLARLLAAHRLRADVFISITPGPIHTLERAGLVRTFVPIASTQMVIAYSPKSRFAPQFKLAAAGKLAWWRVLETRGLRFGRTDPATDPQGQSIIFTIELAAKAYHQPDLVSRILGTPRNPAELFTEASLLSRLQSGEIDAASGYLSAVRSLHLPYITLPLSINLGDPSLAAQYARATLNIVARGKIKALHPQPLVFYAAVLTNARHPRLAKTFLTFLLSKKGQAQLFTYGYEAPDGIAI